MNCMNHLPRTSHRHSNKYSTGCALDDSHVDSSLAGRMCAEQKIAWLQYPFVQLKLFAMAGIPTRHQLELHHRGAVCMIFIHRKQNEQP